MQTAVGATLAVLLVFLLIRSSHTGRAEYEASEEALARIEALDLQINATVFPLMFELQTDFDELTRVQTSYYDAAAEYHARRGDAASEALFEMIRQKSAIIDDFKSNQAVMRNSRAIATTMLNEAKSRDAISGTDAELSLFGVERSFLDFIGRRDPPSIARLRADIAEIESSGSALTEIPEWDTFVAHAEKVVTYSEQLAGVMMGMFTIPVPQQLSADLESLGAWFAARSHVASQYRFGMFAVALLLLAFSAVKVLEVRRYYRVIERARDELESRVAERTRELSEANEALQTEIRDRLMVESQLRIAHKLESIGQLAAGIAHEINTPTQYVSDNVAFVSSAWRDLGPLLDDYEQSIKTGQFDGSSGLAIWKRADVDYLRDEVPAALAGATDGLNQIGRIVRAIKDFSHPGDDTLQPEDLNRAIENAVTVASNEWKYVAELVLELDPSLPKVPCNVSAFNQVILNLVVNSAQAIEGERKSNELGRIRVATRRAGDHAEIIVEDDGPGVPVSIRHQIFDPFFTTKEVGKGTGQGLAIAFRVVTKQHGGTLAVGTASGGRGGSFTIRLPLEQARDGTAEVGADPDLTDTVRRLQAQAEPGDEPSRQTG